MAIYGSEEWKLNISLSLKGKVCGDGKGQFKKGQEPWNKGKHNVQDYEHMKGNTYGFSSDKPSWNTGLTKETDERIAKNGLSCRKPKKVKETEILPDGTIKEWKLNKEEREKHRISGRKGFIAQQKVCLTGNGIWFNTNPEIDMKRCLKELGIKYIFQYLVENIKHPYFADFYFPLYNIILEVDGKEVHNYPDGTEKDYRRLLELEAAGYRVLRFWEGEFNSQSIWKEI